MISERGGRISGMARIFWIILAILLPFAAKGAISLLETPQTVSPGYLSAGLGGTALVGISGDNTDTTNVTTVNMAACGELWLKTGITPRLDIGVSAGVGSRYLEACARYGIIEDYLSAGAGFQIGYGSQKGNLAAQVSLFGGLPGKLLSPYAILHYRYLFFNQPDADTGSSWHTVTGALGLAIRPNECLSFYVEAGGWYGGFPENLLKEPAYPGITAGAGVTFDFPVKVSM